MAKGGAKATVPRSAHNGTAILQWPPPKRQNNDDSEFDEKAHKRISYAVKAQGNTFTQYYVGDPVEHFKLLDCKREGEKPASFGLVYPELCPPNLDIWA
jgi:hypothetical protein